MMRRFFFRRLGKYIKLFMIPTVIVIAACLGYGFHAHSCDIENKTQRSVQSMYEGIETMFQDAIYPYNLVLFNPKFSIGMRKLLSRDKINYLEHSYVYNTTELIQSTINTHPYIASTYFIMDGYSNFYSSDKGVEVLNKDTQWYKTLMEIGEYGGRFTEFRKSVTGRYEVREYVSVYQKMPVGNGAIVVNIAYRDFVDKLKNLPDSNEMLYILNSKGEGVISVPEHEKLTEDKLTELSNKLTENGHMPLKSEWVKLGGQLYCLSTVENTEFGITYVSLISFRSFLDLFLMIGVWLLLLIIVEILVITLICYRITQDSFGHIRQLLTIFSNAEKGIYPAADTEQIRDEYDLIFTNVVRFFINTTFLQSQLEQQKLKKESAEMAALQLQISPHFLFNTLQSLNFEIEKQIGGYQQPNRIIDELSDILKFALHSSGPFVKFRDELDILKKYIIIQKYRFKDSLVFYYEADPETMEIQVPKMILQPLIENSISHGILPLKDIGFIKLKVFIRQEKLCVSVFDTGVGMTSEQVRENYKKMRDPESKNIGLSNVNRRLILNYGESAALKIVSRQGRGCCISFKIPLKHDGGK